MKKEWQLNLFAVPKGPGRAKHVAYCQRDFFQSINPITTKLNWKTLKMKSETESIGYIRNIHVSFMT